MNENFHQTQNQNHHQPRYRHGPNSGHGHSHSNNNNDGEDQRLIEARDRFIRECQMNNDAIQHAMQRGIHDGLVCLHINTRGDNNIVSAEPGKRTLLKHLFLQQPYVRKQIVNYYKQKGFGWVDIVPLNRVDWKIFLFWPHDHMHTPIDQQQQPQQPVQMQMQMQQQQQPPLMHQPSFPEPDSNSDE